MSNNIDRELLSEIQDQLIELYVQRDEAQAALEAGHVCALQIEINDLEVQRRELRSLNLHATEV